MIVWMWLACTAADPAAAPDPGCALGEDLPSIDAAVERLNALPEPTIPCFLRSLPRPLPAVAVASLFSAQPGSWRSPRFFFTLPDLVVSVTPEGPGAHLIEFGEWVDDRNTLKGELVFPVDGVIGAEAPFDHLAYGDGTSCGVCHLDETDDEAPGRFVSAVILPQPGDLVPLRDVEAEAAACDPSLEPDRCAMFDAILGEGEVYQGAFREP